MAANVPSYDTRRIPAGGARVFVGAIGTTPSAEAATISSDGSVKISMPREIQEIRVGLPSLMILSYAKREDCFVEFDSLEINPEQLRYAMGAGITTASASLETFAFGGDPAVTQCAIHVRHESLLGLTMNLYVWKAQGMSDSVQFEFGQNPTTFPYKYAALHSTTDWAGNTLNTKAQLIQLTYQKA